MFSVIDYVCGGKKKRNETKRRESKKHDSHTLCASYSVKKIGNVIIYEPTKYCGTGNCTYKHIQETVLPSAALITRRIL